MFGENRKEQNEYDKIAFQFALNLKNGFDEKENSLLVIEDINHKQWVIYDTSKGMYQEIPFGHIVIELLKEFDMRTEDHIHHRKWIGYMKECGLPDDPLNERITKDIKPYILELKKDIAKIDGYRKSNHLEEMKMALLNDWKRYRMASYENVFRDIMDLTSDNEENYKTYDFMLENEIKESIKSNHEEAVSLARDMYAIHNRYHFCYCDYITFDDKDLVPHTGKAYLALDYPDIFAADLYHVFVSGLSGIPRLCPRCESLFYATNKSKYCDNCKEDSAVIRNEKRKKSVRYYHKKVYDKISQSKKYDNEFRNAFMNESNYYWDIVQGKEVLQNPSYREKIKTKEQYKLWLEMKLKTL